MSESISIDSVLGGRTMPNAYSADMRERVIAPLKAALRAEVAQARRRWKREQGILASKLYDYHRYESY